MPAWFAALDEGQRRLLLALTALVGAVALAVGVVALADDDPSQATVQTDDQVTSSSTASSTTATSTTSSTSTSTTVKSSSTSTTKGKATTTTVRRSGGGPGTTKGTTATTQPTTTTTEPPSGGDEPCATGGGSGGQMATLFCAHRDAKGLPSMVRNGQLDAMAQEWAAKMAADGALSHRPNAEARQMVAARCDCPGWAENVAYDSTVQKAWDEWLKSAPHRANIEDGRDGEYGIGVASGGGYLWFVQVFGWYE